MIYNGIFLLVLVYLRKLHSYIEPYLTNHIFLFSENICGNLVFFRTTLWSANIFAVTYPFITRLTNF